MNDTRSLDRLVSALDSTSSQEAALHRLDEWLSIVRAEGASDLYLVPGVAPSIRVNGTLRPLPEPVLEAEEIERSVLRVLPPHAAVQYRKTAPRTPRSAAGPTGGSV